MGLVYHMVSDIINSMQDPQDKLRLSNNLAAAGHPVNPSDIIPVTADTPMPRTQEMTDVGADITGEDLSYIMDTSLGSLTHGVPTTRVTKSNKFLTLLKQKLFKKKQPDEEVIAK
jgi:hypothetical protein